MATLAERNDPSPRLRDILQGLLLLCGSGLERPLAETLNEFETQLVRQADKAFNNEQQNRYFDSVHEAKRGRPDVVARFLRSIENSLAHLGEDVTQVSQPLDQSPKPMLALTEGALLDESLVLADIATKVELRVREPLYALGYRFGVLAGTPRLAAETMALGPHSLVDALRYGTSHLDLALEHRVLLYRCFERVVFGGITAFYNALNSYLVERGILRNLHALQIRAAPGARAPVTAVARAADIADAAATHARPSSEASAVNPDAPAPTGSRDPRGRRAETAQRLDGQAADFFGTLRRLLGECRRAEAYTASGDDVQRVLTALQARQSAAVLADGKLVLYSGQQIKQEMLAALLELSTDGRAPRIDEEDVDTIDLIAMLFEFLSRRARPDGITKWMLIKLQIPFLRVALKDKNLFSSQAHPARQLLNNIVEVGRFWADEIEAGPDPILVSKLQLVTNRVASEFQGNVAVFTDALQDLLQHVDALVHKVEVAERRYVEAADNREKLEYSRQQAGAAISERLARNKPSEFLRTLLEQAWADVLVVSLLRDGEASSSYRRRLDVVDRLLTEAGENEPDGSSDLRAEVEAGLSQVGLQEDDIQSILRKLFATPGADQDENPISQTELAIKLRSKAKLAVARNAAAPVESMLAVDKTGRLALKPDEQAAFERLRVLPFGTWFEFIINHQGDTVRRKLSWYSAVSGHCLFISQRGTPVEEHTLEELARDIASGRARVAGAEQEPLTDRAWSAIIDTLKHFSAHKQDYSFGAATATEQAAQRQPDPLVAGVPQPQESRTLLLVDDEENILRALARVLRGDGYRILTAVKASEGLEILGQHKIQVIISDQRMPEISGTEFLSKVKEMYPDTVRFMLSGYTDVAAVTDAIDRGAIYKFLTKPWNDEEIRLQVRNAFRAYEARLHAGTSA